MASTKVSTLKLIHDLHKSGASYKEITKKANISKRSTLYALKMYQKVLNGKDYKLIGHKVNQLELLEPVSCRNGYVTNWKCKCLVCGKTINIKSAGLFNTNRQKRACSPSCSRIITRKFKKGDRRGKAVLVDYYRDKINKKSCYVINCDCGNKGVILHRWGRQASCGCKCHEDHPTYITQEDQTAAYILRQYKRGAKRRNKDFSLTMEDIKDIVFKPCHYCGAPPQDRGYLKHWRGKNENRYIKSKTKLFANGIDRVDNSLGYFKENCVPCCSTCNSAKLDRSKEEFIAWIRTFTKWNGDSPVGFKNPPEILKLNSLFEVLGWYFHTHSTKYSRDILMKAITRRRGHCSRAKILGVPYELTLFEDVFIQLSKCRFCNTPTDLVGIDRLDSLKGYTKDNIIPCCLRCNIAKGNSSLKQFRVWRNRLIKKYSIKDFN